MTKFAIAVLAASMLAKPVLSIAGDKPASYVPHAHAKHHVYGSPIGPAIAGHARKSHHQHAPKKQS